MCFCCLFCGCAWVSLNPCWKIKISFFDLIRIIPLLFPLPVIEIKIRIGMTFQKTKFCGGTTDGCCLKADKPGVKVARDCTSWLEIPQGLSEAKIATVTSSVNHPPVIIREGETTSAVQGAARMSCQHLRFAGDRTACSIGLRSFKEIWLETGIPATFLGQGLASLWWAEMGLKDYGQAVERPQGMLEMKTKVYQCLLLFHALWLY